MFLANYFTQHTSKSNESSRRMQVTFENKREQSLDCCVGSSDTGAPCIGVEVQWK